MKADVISEEDELVSVDEEESTEQVGNSRNNLCGVLHGGRPDVEQPHIKKVLKMVGVKIDLILRVDLVRTEIKCNNSSNYLNLQKSLGISEDDFEDLQSLFKVLAIYA